MASVKRSIRNILIILLSIAVVVAAVEFLLGREDADDRLGGETYEQFQKQSEENDMLLNMLMEKSLYEYPFLSALYADPDLDRADWTYIEQILNAEEDESALREAREKDPELFDKLMSLMNDTGEDSRDYHLLSYIQNDADYDGDTFHIVVIGDSFVWGQSSINRNEIFWRILETSLRSQGYDVRVSAVAQPGANSYDELEWLTQSRLVDDLDPDLVIFGYLYNDPDVNHHEYIPTQDEYVDVGAKSAAVAAISKLLPHIGERLANYITARSMYTAEGTYIDLPSTPPILKGAVLEKFENDFMRPLNEFAEKTKIPVALMTLPQYQGKTLQKALYQPLYTLCEKYRNIRLYDSLNDFYGRFVSSKHAANYTINCADFHPGTATHYFYAQFAEAFIKKDFADLLGAPADADLNPKGVVINEPTPGRTLPTLTSEGPDGAVYTVRYPSLKKDYSILSFHYSRYYLTLPLEKDFIALSFATPTALDEISVESDRADGFELYYWEKNEKLGYDDHTVHEAKKEDGVWKFDPSDRVTTLMIHADCKNDDGAVLTVRVKPAR